MVLADKIGSIAASLGRLARVSLIGFSMPLFGPLHAVEPPSTTTQTQATKASANSDHLDKATPESIATWIAQLASGEFDVRDQATSRLSNLSNEELPQLTDALEQATDPEVRVRLSGVIAKLKFERQQRVVRAFLRDPDMSNSHELEGWKTFSAIAGANRSAKRLFLELLDRHPGLVETPLDDPKLAMDKARQVARSIQENEIRLGEGDQTDGLALLYCLCASDALGDNQLSTLSLRTFMRFPYNALFRDVQAKKPMEIMAERWALSLEGGGDLTTAILIMTESDLSTVRSVASKMLSTLEGPKLAEPDELLIALQILFRYGTKDDLPVLTQWLENKEVCMESFTMNLGGGGPGLEMPQGFGGPPGTYEFPPGGVPGGGLPGTYGPSSDGSDNRVIYTVEVRDAAVLACMRITGMEYRDHFPGIVLQEPRGYLPRTIVSLKSADDVREARVEAWRSSQSATPQPPSK